MAHHHLRLHLAHRVERDADDDQDSASADIGPAMKIEDDGPSVTLSLQAGAEVRVDESIGANDFEDETTSLGKVTVSGAVLFATDEAYGSDGAGADDSAYSLALSAPGADSGLVDTATNLSVYLYVDGDDIVGRIADKFRVTNSVRVSVVEHVSTVFRLTAPSIIYQHLLQSQKYAKQIAHAAESIATQDKTQGLARNRTWVSRNVIT